MLAAALILLAGVNDAAAQRRAARAGAAAPPRPTSESILRPSADFRATDAQRALERAARRAAADGFDARDVLAAYERDTRGNWLRRGEIVLAAQGSEAFATAAALGLIEKRRSVLAISGVEIVTYAVPDDASMGETLNALRRAHPNAAIDFNYIFVPQGDGAVALAASAGAATPRTASATIAVIDGPIPNDASAGISFTRRRFASGPVGSSEHGGAVAAILTRATAAAELHIVAADVVAAGPIESAAVDDLAAALDWAASEGAGVINVSLTGPPSQTLAVVVRALSQHGCIVVAAAGNAGPRAAAPFPAALPQTVGVTAVDARGRIWRRATRGDHVDFAALGVDVQLSDTAHVTGTSYAAPLVSGLLARMLAAPDPTRAAAAQAELAERAEDLGAPGRDPVYGLGLLSLH
jgi:hypothetical protein